MVADAQISGGRVRLRAGTLYTALDRLRTDEMLAVLMADARKGQRQPGLLETADVIRSALGMRFSGH